MRLARQNYAQASQLPAPARERAQAALLLATTLYSKDNTSAERSEFDALLADAETILRQRISSKSEVPDILLLAQALESRTPTSDKAARLAMRQEIVTLLTARAAMHRAIT